MVLWTAIYLRTRLRHMDLRVDGNLANGKMAHDEVFQHFVAFPTNCRPVEASRQLLRW